MNLLWYKRRQLRESESVDGKLDLVLLFYDKEALLTYVEVCCLKERLQRHQAYHLRSCDGDTEGGCI